VIEAGNEMHDLQKIIVSLVAVLLGSWALFGFIVKRWLDGIDNDIRELFESRNSHANDIGAIKARCEERHK
jgi:chorismate mutase